MQSSYKEEWSELASYARRPKIYIKEGWYGGNKFHTFKSAVGVTGKSRFKVERDAIGRAILYIKTKTYPYYESFGRFPARIEECYHKDY